MKEKMNLVPKVSIHRDPRFSLEYNWEQVVVPAIKEAQERGVLVTPLTVFGNGGIAGWYLHGWTPGPAKILYEYKEPIKEEVLDYII